MDRESITKQVDMLENAMTSDPGLLLFICFKLATYSKTFQSTLANAALELNQVRSACWMIQEVGVWSISSKY